MTAEDEREQETAVRIELVGNPDDLYALALLFAPGACSDFVVTTAILGEKVGTLDRVKTAASTATHVSGPGCLPLADVTDMGVALWTARSLIAPLNGFAAMADANFSSVEPKSAEVREAGRTSTMGFDLAPPRARARLITADRHAGIGEALSARVSCIMKEPLAAFAVATLTRPPSWSAYFILLEDIAADRGVSISTLDKAGLAHSRILGEFTMAANNRFGGRHGFIRSRKRLNQAELMNLLEAREFVRRVVTRWFDEKCGGRMPVDRVDGPPLRFGLDRAEVPGS